MLKLVVSIIVLFFFTRALAADTYELLEPACNKWAYRVDYEIKVGERKETVPVLVTRNPDYRGNHAKSGQALEVWVEGSRIRTTQVVLPPGKTVEKICVTREKSPRNDYRFEQVKGVSGSYVEEKAGQNCGGHIRVFPNVSGRDFPEQGDHLIVDFEGLNPKTKSKQFELSISSYTKHPTKLIRGVRFPEKSLDNILREISKEVPKTKSLACLERVRSKSSPKGSRPANK